MAVPLQIVDDCGSHARVIGGIVRVAFAEEYGSGDGEVALIAALRAAGDVAVELVALHDGEVVGHAMFSRLTVKPATLKVAALAPVAARIDRQRQGIGSALIRDGLARCATLGFDAVTVLGDPDYYRKFGFSPETARRFDCAYNGPAFQALELHPHASQLGRWTLVYPAAFSAV